jgi:hypothetical protein
VTEKSSRKCLEITIVSGKLPDIWSAIPIPLFVKFKRNSEKLWYHPIHTNEEYNKRRKHSKVRIIDKNNEIREHIIEALKDGTSPGW